MVGWVGVMGTALTHVELCVFVCVFVPDRARVIFKERVNRVAFIKADTKVSTFLALVATASIV